MNRTLSPARRAAAAVAACVAALVGMSALAGPAWAHGGAGTLEVVSTEPQADGTSVKVTVQLSFTKDGHPADDATVTVVGELQGGGSAPEFTPVTLTASGPEGQYAGVVPIPGPGTWNLRVTSVEPPATATTQVSTAATTRTEGSSTAPSTTAAAPTTTESSAVGEQDDGSGSSMVPAVVAGAVGGAVAAGIASFVMLRRKAAGSAGPAED